MKNTLYVTIYYTIHHNNFLLSSRCCGNNQSSQLQRLSCTMGRLRWGGEDGEEIPHPWSGCGGMSHGRSPGQDTQDTQYFRLVEDLNSLEGWL